jgi:hypothetical protein
MKFRVRIRAAAREDIRSARDWYEDQVPGLGKKFGEALDGASHSSTRIRSCSRRSKAERAER